jgi:hypothetical protein
LAEGELAMKPAFALSAFFAATSFLALVLYGTDGSKTSPPRDYVVSDDPTQVIMTMGARDMVHPPGAHRLELFGDGWLQRHSYTDGGSKRSAVGVRIDRGEIGAAFADAVNFGLLEADLREIREAVQPTSGVLPDGRRWVEGGSEPGTGWSVTMHFEQVQVSSGTQFRYPIKFNFEPFVRYRGARMDIPAIEGIARVADRVASWIAQLEAAEGGPK